MAKFPISKDYRHNSQLKAVIPRNQAVPIMSVILTLSHKTLTQHTSSHSEAYGDRSTPHSRQRIPSLIKQVRSVPPQSTSYPHTPSHSEAHGVRFTPSRPFRIITPVLHLPTTCPDMCRSPSGVGHNEISSTSLGGHANLAGT